MTWLQGPVSQTPGAQCRPLVKGSERSSIEWSIAAGRNRETVCLRCACGSFYSKERPINEQGKRASCVSGQTAGLIDGGDEGEEENGFKESGGGRSRVGERVRERESERERKRERERELLKGKLFIM